MTTKKTTALELLHGLILYEGLNKNTLMMMKLMTDARFASDEFAPIVLNWPSPPYSPSLIAKTENELHFQLKWQRKILDTLASLPLSKVENITLPTPPYTSELMQRFVQDRKGDKIGWREGMEALFILSTSQKQQKNRIQWVLADHPKHLREYEESWSQILGGLFPPIQQILASPEGKSRLKQASPLLLDEALISLRFLIHQGLSSDQKEKVQAMLTLMDILKPNQKKLLQLMEPEIDNPTPSGMMEIQEFIQKWTYGNQIYFWLVGNYAKNNVEWAVHLTSINLHNKNIWYIPTSLVHLKQLAFLNLSRNQVKEFPLFISDLQKLTSLIISDNKLKEIPLFIRELKQLTSLDLSNNNIKEIPIFIGKMERLKNIYLNNNQIKELPTFIQKLRQLNGLHLGGNQIKEIPQFLRDIEKLRSLNLSGNQIKRIPVQITFPNKLISLNLSKNELHDLPEIIENLDQLTSLDLSNNQLKKFPPFIRDLKRLDSLDLGENQITVFPSFIGELSFLSSLKLTDNQITEIPKQITSLNKLISLDLNNNQIKDLPLFISEMQCLTFLYLRNNLITEIPEGIESISRIKKIDLRENPLKEKAEKENKKETVEIIKVEEKKVGVNHKLIIITILSLLVYGLLSIL